MAKKTRRAVIPSKMTSLSYISKLQGKAKEQEPQHMVTHIETFGE